MAEKKVKSPIPQSVDFSSLLGSNRGTVPHAAGSGSHVPGTATDTMALELPGEGAIEPVAEPSGVDSGDSGVIPVGDEPVLVDSGAPMPVPEVVVGTPVGTGAAPQVTGQSGLKTLTGVPRKVVPTVSDRKKLIGVLIDSLGSGAVKGAAVSNDRKAYGVGLSIPASVYGLLAQVAGNPRQVGETLREALGDLVSQCQFEATLATYRVSLKKAYGAFVEVRKAARKLGGGGMRPVTVNLSEGMTQHLLSLSKDLDTTPIRLLESLAYQLSLLAPTQS